MINAKHANNRDTLKEKRESGVALEKCDFPPERGNVDTYDKYYIFDQLQAYIFHIIHRILQNTSCTLTRGHDSIYSVRDGVKSG